MAFIVNSLPNYVEQNNKELISRVVFSAPSVKYFNLMTGVKYQEAINLLDTDPTLQERTCGFDQDGDVTFTQAIMTVGNYKVNMTLCEEALRKKWMNSELLTKAGAEVLPFEEKITSDIVKKVSKQIESLIWTANTDNNDLFNGVIAQLPDTSEVTPNSETIYGMVKELYLEIPSEKIDSTVIFMGVDLFRNFALDLVQQNLYHYTGEVNSVMEIILPGTNTKVVGVSGLNETGYIIAADPETLYYGVDMADDAEEFKLWYSDDNQEFRLAIKFNAGVAVVYPGDTRYIALTQDSDSD